MPQYKQGDWVSVKAQVIRDEGDRIVVARKTLPMRSTSEMVNFDISPDQIDRQIPKPLPAEPPREAILRSSKTGRLYSWREGVTPTSTGWAATGGGAVLHWDRDFYQSCGPFEVFEPNRTV